MDRQSKQRLIVKGWKIFLQANDFLEECGDHINPSRYRHRLTKVIRDRNSLFLIIRVYLRQEKNHTFKIYMQQMRVWQNPKNNC